MRTCRACATPLQRHANERTANWARRTVCNEACRMALLCQRIRALDAKKITLPCKRCGVPCQRSARFRSAIACPACVDHFRQANATSSRARQRLKARRYEILMTALGFDDFAELMDYLRTVPWTNVDGVRKLDLRRTS